MSTSSSTISNAPRSATQKVTPRKKNELTISSPAPYWKLSGASSASKRMSMNAAITPISTSNAGNIRLAWARKVRL